MPRVKIVKIEPSEGDDYAFDDVQDENKECFNDNHSLGSFNREHSDASTKDGTDPTLRKKQSI